ncbi:hypothetical protein QBC43DRAFT_314648 [Cladorrhinum sp. PSN259]|nr:hypothetical protein QBC43DRAFT_314648 [Cladorrhinum sp. PSN259]
MPTYLAHGFRWHRQSIIIHSIVHDLDDCSPDWIASPNSSACLLGSFSKLYNLNTAQLKLLEEYDTANLTTSSAAHAYVADHVVRVDLSCDVGDEIKKYDGKDGVLEKLRDEIEKGEDVKWYVIVCGDEERDWPGKNEEDEEEEEKDEEEEEEEGAAEDGGQRKAGDGSKEAR